MAVQVSSSYDTGSKMPSLSLPSWLYYMITLNLRSVSDLYFCFPPNFYFYRFELRWRSWWRNGNTRTTITVDQEWVWLNINWGIAGDFYAMSIVYAREIRVMVHSFVARI